MSLTPGGESTGLGSVRHTVDGLVVPVDVVLVLRLTDTLTF